MAKKTNRIDPTRTFVLRRRYASDMTRRFKSTIKAIKELIVEDDAFGLKEKKLENPFKTLAEQYKYLSDPEKLTAFQNWLKKQTDAKILSVEDGDINKPWTAKYINSAYRQGIVRSYTQVHSESLAKTPDWYLGSKEGFLKMAFAQPIAIEKVRMLALRSFTDLKGVTQDMDAKLSRILADGIVSGHSPIKVARLMTQDIEGLLRKRALVISRTEIIRAHAEGELDSYELLGIDSVKADVEFITAGDDVVCDKCSSLEGKVFKIKDAHGIIPVHPNCRCGWTANV